MNAHPFTKMVATVLMILLVMPSAFFSLTPHAHAIPVAVVADGSATSLLDLAKNTLTSIQTTTAAAATLALQVNQYVLQPLAFVMSVGLIKAMTAGVIAFVIGQTNGTGRTQFVQNLQGTLQQVGDIKAKAFFLQIGRTNSPFAQAINSSLRTTYLQQTSMAGFWAANKCTLGAVSPNVNQFLAGQWSQGGTRAWLALTTEPQNNPYMLYQNSQSQLASVVADAQSTRQQVVSWGQGFMSWCGSTDSSSSGEVSGSGTSGVNPGDPCENADGTPGIVQTPGTVIVGTLNKVLGGAQDVLSHVGSVASEVTQILGNVATVFQTVNLAQSILGGTGSGGLAGFGNGGSNSGLAVYNRSAFLGDTNSTVYQQNGAPIQASAATLATSRTNDFETAWNTVASAAQSTSATLTSLIALCSSVEASTTQIAQVIQQANTALSTEVAPVLAQAAAASNTIAASRAFIAQVTSEQNLQTDSGQAAYFSDLQTLQTMSPTITDTSNMQQQAIASGTAIQPDPNNPLTVSGGSLVDQMSLISSEATTLRQYCTAGDGGGGG